MTCTCEQRRRGGEWIRPVSLGDLWLCMKLQHNLKNGRVLLWLWRVQLSRFSRMKSGDVPFVCSVSSLCPLTGLFLSHFLHKTWLCVCQTDAHLLHTLLIAFWCKWCNMMADNYTSPCSRSRTPALLPVQRSCTWVRLHKPAAVDEHAVIPQSSPCFVLIGQKNLIHEPAIRAVLWIFDKETIFTVYGRSL